MKKNELKVDKSAITEAPKNKREKKQTDKALQKNQPIAKSVPKNNEKPSKSVEKQTTAKKDPKTKEKTVAASKDPVEQSAAEPKLGKNAKKKMQRREEEKKA